MRCGHCSRCGQGEFRFEAEQKDGFSSAQQLGSFLAQCRHRLSPRALSLTGFLRLAVVDQFVHGIGGALYDRVTDQILAKGA